MKLLDKLSLTILISITLIIAFSSIPSFIKWIINTFLVILILSILLGREKIERKSSYRFDEIAKMFGGKCMRCSSTENLEKHHKVPLYKGGTNDLDNIVVLCNSCHKEEHRRR